MFITRFYIACFAWLLLISRGQSLQAQDKVAQQKIHEFLNGKWFDGKNFGQKIFYSVNGLLTSKKPARVDSVIDLSGRYVIPPFGEAHNHNIEYSPRIESVINRYLQAGIFYVKNPNNLVRTRTPLAGKINVPTSIDVVFSNGSLTASGGHPIGVFERNIAREIWSAADGEGGFYFAVDNKVDLDNKWNLVLDGHPDFIKTYLLYSEEYEKRKDDDAHKNWRGLDPSLLPEIVRRAHQAGLRVSTHVETATDFHNALVAGVDEINHLPGFRAEKDDPTNYQNLSRYEISKSDAILAARKKVFVVTTLADALNVMGKLDEHDPAAAFTKDVRALFQRNLRLLAKHHAQIAIGSDSYGKTSLMEAMGLYELNVFDNLTLLKMWCETTVQTIFPKRPIGALKDGNEASFLVLTEDPIRDFKNVTKIAMRVKQGEILPSLKQ